MAAVHQACQSCMSGQRHVQHHFSTVKTPMAASIARHGPVGPSYPHTPSSCPLCHTLMLCREPAAITGTHTHIKPSVGQQPSASKLTLSGHPQPANNSLCRQHPCCVCALEHPLVHMSHLHMSQVMPHHGVGARQHGCHQWLLGQLLLSQHQVCHVLLHGLQLWGLVEEDGAS